CDFFFFSSRRRHTRFSRDWSSDVCSSDLLDLFDKHKVMFKSATEPYETTSAIGRLFVSIVGSLAQWERENMIERVKMAMEKRARSEERRVGKECRSRRGEYQ